MTSVLVVDDDDQLRVALARELSERGFQVEVAQSVDQAVAVLEKGAVDVLVTDLRMNDRDGIDLLATVRQVSSHTRAVLMSAYATARDYQTAVDLGAVRVLCKPFTASEALSAVQQAVECETGYRGSIHGLSLVDMLQMFHYGRRSISIAVSGVTQGIIHIRDGQIVHAVRGEKVGEDALRAILSAQSGAIATSVLPASIPQTVQRDFQSLLLDLLRQLDESGRDGDLDDMFGDIAPTPSVEEMTPSAVAALPPSIVDALARRLPALGLESAVSVFDAETRQMVPIVGAGPDDAAGPPLLGILEVAARLAGKIERVESVGDAAAFALLACDGGARFVVLSNVPAGRYAPLRFRAEVGRVLSVLVALESRTGGTNGQDR